MTAPTTAMDGLLVNAAHLDALTDRARRSVAAGQVEAAAAWVQTAATFAWMNHCGLFASGPLEQLLGEISARTTPFEGAPRPARGEVRRVLHVATQLYATGGHTQALRCWLDQDAGRQHRLVVTRQGPAPIPTKIAEALPDRDQIALLDRQPGALLRRAGRLREAAEWADLVILHTHNNDVVPTLALSAAPWLPPSIQVDSNDHTFWIGRTGASLVMHMRESGRELAGRRRGLAPADSFVLERPLRFRTRTATRAEAKRSLGLDPDQVVIATAADPTKFRPVSAVSFLDLLVPVLRERRDAVLVAAGPSAGGVWSEAAAATGGRVRALGLIPDVSRLHEATDIYVDSFPFASLTSLLESGSLGNPTVTFRGHPAGCEVLGADTRGLDDLMLTPRTPTEFCAAVTDLIDDERRRADLGRRTAEQIVATHTGPRWLKEAQLMYAEAQARPGRIVPSRPHSETGELDRLVALVMQRTGLATGVRGALLGNAGLLPARDRLRVLQEQRPRLNRSLARWVLSEWQQTVAVRSRRRLQTWVR